jgi:hypothetical protein
MANGELDDTVEVVVLDHLQSHVHHCILLAEKHRVKARSMVMAGVPMYILKTFALAYAANLKR